MGCIYYSVYCSVYCAADCSVERIDKYRAGPILANKPFYAIGERYKFVTVSQCFDLGVVPIMSTGNPVEGNIEKKRATEKWSIDKALATYNTRYWSEGYFDLNNAGRLEVCVTNGGQCFRGEIKQLLTQITESGLRFPVLIRFKDILRDRVRQLNNSFRRNSDKLGYAGGYTVVYPIKVNQQRRVVEPIVSAHDPVNGIHVGLEAGSKPELLAVLALSAESTERSGVVICNGYKDQEYVRLALIGQKMGLDVTIVIEKLSELPLVFQEAKQLNIKPQLGVRVRLSSIGKGQWQNTGGEKAKFGLQASQLLVLVEDLKNRGMLQALSLVHFHMGSQVSDAQDIQQCVTEASRYFIELKRLGAPLQYLDVGGGLGVDYEGTRSHSYFSMNYSVDEYAYHILQPIKEACDQYGYDHPHIITESGRALTAHHAILVTDVIATEALGKCVKGIDHAGSSQPLSSLLEGYQETCVEYLTERQVIELYHKLQHLMQQAQDKFKHAQLCLQEWASVEKAYYAACRNIMQFLDPGLRAHQLIQDELNELLAEKFFVNFSLFQSLPDVWGIGQVFPIMPIENLDIRPTTRAVIHDMTCDSDGRIDQYVDRMGLESTLPLPDYKDNEPYYLAFFMVGAYQEILGDMHNLFGDTDSVDVELIADNQFTLSNPVSGDNVESVLKYVDFDSAHLYGAIERCMQESALSEDEKLSYLAAFSEGLKGYTYLEVDG